MISQRISGEAVSDKLKSEEGQATGEHERDAQGASWGDGDVEGLSLRESTTRRCNSRELLQSQSSHQTAQAAREWRSYGQEEAPLQLI